MKPTLTFYRSVAHDIRLIATHTGKIQTPPLRYELSIPGASSVPKRILRRRIEHRHQSLRSVLRWSVREYQQSWNAINDNFFSAITRVTRIPWRYVGYRCLVSAFSIDQSSWEGNTIVRRWSDNPLTMRRVTAHELLVGHGFQILRTTNLYDRFTIRQAWACSELLAWTLIAFERRLNACWPWWTTPESRWPLRHNYPELIATQKRVGSQYLRTAFPKWIVSTVRSVRRLRLSPTLPGSDNLLTQ